MHRLLNHLRSQAIAYLALFIALGGTGYAATRLPAGSVGTRALKNHSVTPVKFARGSIAGYLRAYVELNAQGQITQATPAATVTVAGSGSQPAYSIHWSVPISQSCFALATPQHLSPTDASAVLFSGGKADAQTAVVLASPAPVAVAVMCPQP